MKTAFSRQKSYVDPKRKDVSFSPGDLVFLKVSPMKGVMRFGKKGKLAPRYIGPFEIKSRVSKVAYRLLLPPELSRNSSSFTRDEVEKEYHRSSACTSTSSS